MTNVVKIDAPTSFARGVIIRRGNAPPNMLVVRDLGHTVAVVQIEGDAAGSVRVREVRSEGLVQVLGIGDAP